MHMAITDARQCSALSKRSRQRCRAPAVRGSSKCRMHGGKGSGRPAAARGLCVELLCAALQPLEEELLQEEERQRAYVQSIIAGALD